MNREVTGSWGILDFGLGCVRRDTAIRVRRSAVFRYSTGFDQMLMPLTAS